MLLILISWVYILLTLVNFGFLANHILSIKNTSKLFHLVFGLVIIMIISHVWAFYDGFGILFHSLLLILNGVIFIIFYKHFLIFYKGICQTFNNLKSVNKVLLLIIFLVILAKSASQGSMLDNETYYVQTIKWLNEYGFVKGLANLHLFFGQNSGWHVLQSVFSFHFIEVDFNDLGSFLLLILNFYVVSKLNIKKGSFNSLAFLPVFNFMLLEFCVVPSPDFGIIFFAILIGYLFIKSYKKPQIHDFYLILLMFLSAMLVKITAIGLFIFPLVLLLKMKSKPIELYKKTLFILSGFACIWLCKNLIISGYPFYPSDFLSDYINLNYQVPKALYNVSLRKEKLLEFFVTPHQIKSLSNWDLFIEWLNYSKVSLVFNSSLLLLVIAIPILFIKLRLKSVVWWIYISFLFQLIFLAFTSPQYRFAIHYLVIFTLLIFSQNRFARKHNFLINSLFQLIAICLILFPIRLNQLSKKNYSFKPQKLQVENLLMPHSNSSIQSNYEIKELGNLIYYSPVDTVYFWSNGSCGLPCVNSTQLNFISKEIKYRPQLLHSTKLSEGFYSQKIPQK